MPRKNMTLRDALLRLKPFIPCTATDTKNSKYPPWPNVTARHWTEFNIQTLDDSYDNILDTELPSDVVDTLTPPVVLDGITKWAKLHLGLQEGCALYHQFTHADQTVVAKLPHTSTKLNIDHSILLQNVQRIQRDALVVDLGRTSTKWTSLPIVRKHTDIANETMWPLRQVANLCRIAGTRYRYIQTNVELVSDWKVAVQSVPWNTEVSSGSGRNILTTELALCDGHRELVPEKDLVPIDAWDTLVSNDERGKIRRHQYSQRELLANTPTPSSYETPEYGNAAAVAGIGGIDYPERGVDILNYNFGVSFLSHNI
ncbi:hypothetical protein Sste5346_009444 [Sporothrix stenoceras]|uniref:Uncharacterized protein n=1 Tax=Sporothrix stenoceras TaxID=5173 RepID=A0ABR3YLA0_9PEZI